MKHRVRTIAWIAACSAPGLLGQPVGARQPAEAPGDAARTDPPRRLLSLDEALGIAGDGRTAAGVPDPARLELDRKLSQEQAGEQFAQAVELMSQVTARIEQDGDTGLTTQRLQEDAIRKLDMVLASARRQESPSESQGQASASTPSGQDAQPAQSTAAQGQTDPRAAAADDPGEHAGPERQDGPLGPTMSAVGATWGGLPPRVRDALRQGTSDRFSAFYDALTRRYYQRLAEEAGR